MGRRGARRALLVLAVAGAAGAAPPDWVHDVEPGREKFVKLPRLDWVEVEDPTVASAEWLSEANELLLSGRKPGRTLLLLGADGKVAVWRLRVGGKPLLDEGLAAAAKKACADFRLARGEEPGAPDRLAVTVAGEPCRAALAALFATDAFEARALELTFDGPTLQAQLKSVQEGLATVTQGQVTARYVGAGLVLEGQLTAAGHRAMLWELYRRLLGRFALDDRIEVAAPPEAPDAGQPAEAPPLPKVEQLPKPKPKRR